MFIKDIQRFEDNRDKVNAYMTYILTKNIPNKLPDIHLQSIKTALDKIAHEISVFDALYILDTSGRQIENIIALKKEYEIGEGEDRSARAYFYRAVKLRRCILSDPYPSNLNNELCVTASMPIYNDKDILLFVVCIDIKLEDILKLIQAGNFEFVFLQFSRFVYCCFALVLFTITCFLFQKGLFGLFGSSNIGIQEMFESTIAITLALAIFDLAKTIIEEEVLGKIKKETNGIQKTMVRFLGSIIIALAIEALMLVFKLAISDLSQMIYVIYLIIGVTLLLAGLSMYLFAIKYKNNTIL
ncbi:PDC sensor domain-containing protein [Campylobacter sp. MIT 21-1685]|uniref:PDC sensor domain-containing protein n=1 Tax=unclassified Campylobacter TaxID=2593542 RepID=UPI00224B2F86|nr:MULTISPECIES: PDC sensor domain-containing protein [unclassified Campylobacter]MCX2683213.1 PDC sensor domain-containing protein [Campylobacter sp. MIT 21-1684]MCX2751467.1 PDC sensor domain-containing protein [Campylobacter sp. MIT 21-1682]MCX2807694.1 PDC sensor domain-containing protein [Campylobacter sp. MIT 21-1685]